MDFFALSPEQIERLSRVLCCPDDRQPIESEGHTLVCIGCGRKFPMLEGGGFDLLPRQPMTQETIRNKNYLESYAHLSKANFSTSDFQMAWGSAEETSPEWQINRFRQVAHILPLVLRKKSGILCDLSAGAGRYTLEYSKHFSLVLHCDLSVGSLQYIAERKRSLRIDNLIPLRTDYFNPPFQGSIDVVLCMDSLIRGEEHELLLLRTIQKCLSPNGIAIIDFHNWWHNPFRRLGMLKNNFAGNRSYSRSQAELILRNAGIRKFEYLPFCQEFDTIGICGAIGSRVIPPTRLVYSFGREA